MDNRFTKKRGSRRGLENFVILSSALLWACPSNEVVGLSPPPEVAEPDMSASQERSGEPSQSPEPESHQNSEKPVLPGFLADVMHLEISEDMIHPDSWLTVNESQIMQQISRFKVGQLVDTSAASTQTPDSWLNLGMEKVEDGIFQMMTPMQVAVPFVPTASEAMPGIDCVVMSSIDRHNGSEPYVYRTLHSSFIELPQDAHINILVGNADVAYLQHEVLAKKGFSAEQIARIHVWPASSEQNEFLDKHFPRTPSTSPNKPVGRASNVERRASWNYARALLSYRGSKRLLMLEDDIDWATNSVDHMVRMQTSDTTLVVSLFELSCRHLDKAPDDAPILYRVPMAKQVSFWCTQAMTYSAQVANPMGRYLALRMHVCGYDQLISNFMNHHGVVVGYTHPSLVQHTGVCTTGCSGWLPTAKCFQAYLPPVQPLDSPADLDRGSVLAPPAEPPFEPERVEEETQEQRLS